MKDKRRIFGIIIAQVVLFAFLTKSYALDRQTHRTLNEYIANNTVADFSLHAFLQNQLQFPEGKEGVVNSKQAWKWLRDGGEKEDDSGRFFAHFHNPLTDWGFKNLFAVSYTHLTLPTN